MRIAVFVSGFPLPSETFIVDQVARLLDRGHEVDIHATAPGPVGRQHPAVAHHRLLERTRYESPIPRGWLPRVGSALRLLARAGPRDPVPCLRALDARRYGRRAASLELLHRVAPFLPPRRYDVVHAHFGANGLRALLLRGLGALCAPLVTTFHGHDATLVPAARGHDVYRGLFEAGELFTVGSQHMAGRLVALGCPTDRLVELPVPVHPVFFDRPTGQPVVADGAGPRLLTIARLVEKKGVEYALRAVAAVAPRHRALVYSIAGDGPLRGSLERLAAELGIAGQVRFLGAVAADEARDLYASSDVFLLPSVTSAAGDEEGQGLVLQEAQAMGLPVLSTRHNGIPEGVLDGASGYLVPERDAAALAEQLAHVLDHPETWPNMGRVGRAFVEGRYHPDALTDRLVEIYVRLAAPVPPAAASGGGRFHEPRAKRGFR